MKDAAVKAVPVDVMDEARRYQSDRLHDALVKNEPYYDGPSLRAAFRHGYDFAKSEAAALPLASVEQADAHRYATRLLVSLMEKHFPDRHPEWAPLPDLIGVLTQIDNMSTGLTRKPVEAGRSSAEPVAEPRPLADLLMQVHNLIANTPFETGNYEWAINVDKEVLAAHERLLAHPGAGQPAAVVALLDFAKWAIREGAFQGCDLDGGSIQDKAHELGLIEQTTYDPKKHGPSDCADAGSEWFVFSEILSSGNDLRAVKPEDAK